jgi:hypothetical protein
MLAAFVELPGDRIKTPLTLIAPGGAAGSALKARRPCFLESRKAIPQATSGCSQ